MSQLSGRPSQRRSRLLFVRTSPCTERWLDGKGAFNWHSLFGLTCTFQQNIIHKWISSISCCGIPAMPLQSTFGFALETSPHTPPPPDHIDTRCVSQVTWRRWKGEKQACEVLQSLFLGVEPSQNSAAVGFLRALMSKQTLDINHQFVSRVVWDFEAAFHNTS